MSVTEYEAGDDIARGVVDECPRCGNLPYRRGECEHRDCGYSEFAYDDDDYEERTW